MQDMPDNLWASDRLCNKMLADIDVVLFSLPWTDSFLGT